LSIYRLKGASGAVINQSHVLGKRTVIGRADDCDLRVATASPVATPRSSTTGRAA